MKRLTIIVVAISCFLAAPIGVSGQNGHNRRSKAHGSIYVPGELLVKFDLDGEFPPFGGLGGLVSST